MGSDARSGPAATRLPATYRREMTMPDIKIPEFTADLTKAAHDLADVAKDATYVVIGAGVLGFQKAQVHRQELQKRLGDPKATVEDRLQAARSDLGEAIHAFDL